jgi:phosphatidylinositol-bisphosphatase
MERILKNISIINFKEIIEEYNLIKLKYNSDISFNFNDINISTTDFFNLSFLMGDFNYRIDHNNSYISSCLRVNDLESILKYDQMKIEISNCRINLCDFKEAEINFIPTYKFNPGTNNYELGKEEKIPGWTDRIFYKFKNIYSFIDFKIVEYHIIKDIYLSDHKPVKASFEIKF